MAVTARPVYAQESTNVPAGTQPSVGSFYLRERLQYVRLGDDPSPADRDIDKVVATTTLAYGLTREWSVSMELPLVYENSTANHVGHDSHTSFGVNDFTLAAKWRPWQYDLGPVDSLRFAVFGGVELPSGDGDFSSHSVDPFLGGVFTGIIGRHGFNAALTYKNNNGSDAFNTRAGDGPSDAIRVDSSYLFRLSPAAYSSTTTAATYLTLELNGLYETNGDWEVVVGPGLLYEARTFALEATVGLPVASDVDERPETELVLTFGVRFLF
jgi:hypothetical protein